MRRFLLSIMALALCGCASGAARSVHATAPSGLRVEGHAELADWSAAWISGAPELDHAWDDATVEWDFTLLGDAVSFLFRAAPDGKTYGNAYVWRVSMEGGAHLELVSRRYSEWAPRPVSETVLRRVALPAFASGSRHRLLVRAEGARLTTSFDGAQIDVLENSDHRRGTVGVFANVANAALLHTVSVAPTSGEALVETFANNDSRMSGGAVVAGGLLVAANATNTDIVFPISRPAPLLRRDFHVEQPVRQARLYVAAGGFPRVEINGRQINDAIGDGFTAYDRRVLYRAFDVTDAVRRGDNAIGVELGRGWYSLVEPNEWFWHAAPWHQPAPTVRMQLELTFADGSSRTIGTDETWRWTDGPTRHDSIYAGERYDARVLPRNWSRAGFDAGAWRAAHVVVGPAGALDAADHEPIGVTETLRPVALTQPLPGVWVFDFGRIFAGRVRLRVRGPAGQTVSMAQHEQLLPDGTVRLFGIHVDAQLQTDRYVLSGQGTETWAPQFGYRGFRYVEVRGFPGAPTLDSLIGEVMHSDVASIGQFESSNALINQIHQAARRTILNNMHGFQTDTPTFEKNGWTGDAHASSLASALNFDVSRVWTKWMADFRDAQAPSGEIPEIVPSTPLYGYENTPGWSMVMGPTPSWDAATFVMPNDLYELTGDTRLLAEMYDTQKRLLDYTSRWFTRDFLYANPSNTQLGEYGIFVPPGTPRAPSEPQRRIAPGSVDAVATAYYFHMADLFSRNARLLGHAEDAETYAALAARIRRTFNQRYWDGTRYRLPADARFYQYLNVLPVAFGLAPEDRRASIIQQVSDDIAANNYRLTSTGVFAGRYIMLLLSDYGHGETAYRLATQTELPSWGYWLANDINTMQEMWPLTSRSRDHHYWGSVSSWFYQGLAGIRPGAPGYERIVIRPTAPSGLNAASASIETVRGRIASSWRRENGEVLLHVVIPVGTRAEIWCPGAPADQAQNVEAGAYDFTCS